MSGDFGVWLAAIATLAVFSYLWKNNPVFTLAEHLFVALTTGHLIVTAYFNIKEMAITPLIKGSVLWIVPIVLGILLYARFWKNLALYSRMPIAFLVGVGASLSVQGQVDASLVRQVTSTILPLNNINNILVVIGTVTSVTFFFFTVKAAKGPLASIGTIGRWMLMVAFGAAYGNTVMGRMSLIIGRFGFLMRDWLGVIK